MFKPMRVVETIEFSIVPSERTFTAEVGELVDTDYGPELPVVFYEDGARVLRLQEAMSSLQIIDLFARIKIERNT